MSAGELLQVALTALQRNKLRSFLTLLGVIIGVMTVVAVVSVISGLNGYVQEKVMNLSPDVLVFTKYGIIRGRQEYLLAKKRKPISMADAQVVAKQCRSCGAVGTSVNDSSNVHAGSRKLSGVSIQGYSANMESMLNIDLEAGRFFTPSEEDHAAAVGIIGYDVKDQCFPTVNPIGRTLYLGGYPITVIGVQTKEGSVFGENRDTVVFLPVTFVRKVLTSKPDVSIYVRPRLRMAGVDATQDEVRTILRSIRKTPFSGDDPFGIVGSEAIQSLWNSITASAFGLMILISGISLVVGAIVIANIMFVSVVERTKEIGLRMALGARRRDIKRQFLLESALLATGGGIVGVLLGALVAMAVNQVFPARVRFVFVLVGIGTATITGLLAGLAPSSSASKLPPVEALRFE
ncbi:MAG TPA: ABC transporter permease [Thermoanaerobaculia bacterium]|nr:ABC transporter permease [Thermoanaerobaculia bacterium]